MDFRGQGGIGAAIAQTIIGVIAVCFALYESRKWRKQLLNSKKIDLAIRLGKVSIALRDGFRDARNPLNGTVKAPEYRPESTTEQKIKQNEEYNYNLRLELIKVRLEPLYEIRWEMSVLFDENESIVELVKLYNGKFSELQNAMESILYDDIPDDLKVISLNKVIAGRDGTDEFGKSVEAITDKMLEIAGKYTR